MIYGAPAHMTNSPLIFNSCKNIAQTPQIAEPVLACKHITITLHILQLAKY